MTGQEFDSAYPLQLDFSLFPPTQPPPQKVSIGILFRQPRPRFDFSIIPIFLSAPVPRTESKGV